MQVLGKIRNIMVWSNSFN